VVGDKDTFKGIDTDTDTESECLVGHAAFVVNFG